MMRETEGNKYTQKLNEDIGIQIGRSKNVHRIAEDLTLMKPGENGFSKDQKILVLASAEKIVKFDAEVVELSEWYARFKPSPAKRKAEKQEVS